MSHGPSKPLWNRSASCIYASLHFPVRCFHRKESTPRVTGFSQNRGTVGRMFTFRCYHLRKEELVKTQFWFYRIKKENIPVLCFSSARFSKQALFEQHESSCNQIRQNHLVASSGRCKSPYSRASHGMPAEWGLVQLRDVCHHSCVGTLRETLPLSFFGSSCAANL